MDSLKQWALCLVIGAAAGTLVMVISPRGATNKTVRAVVGIFIVAVIGVPFADMIKSGCATEVFAAYDYSDGDADMSEFMLESFCESVKKEIQNSARNIGVPLCEVVVEADTDADSCIIIHKITVKIDSEFSDKVSELSDILSKTTGVFVTVIAE